MTTYLLSRLARTALVVLVVLLVTFVLLRLSGDPTAVMLPPDATADERARLVAAMGLDKPLYQQYLLFMSGVVRGDFGVSVRYRQPVSALLRERLAATVQLAVASLALAVVLGVPLGVVQALRPGSLADHLGTVASVAAFSMPSFWLGMMLIVLFAVRLQWLPSSGYGSAAHFVLPATTLASGFIAYTSLLVRNGMLETMSADYVRTARAKGLRLAAVILRHALPNCLIPVVSVLALQAGTLLGGAVVTESVFQWPGVGLLALQAIHFRDFPVVQGTVFFLAMGVAGMNFVAELLYARLDPRIRHG